MVNKLWCRELAEKCFAARGKCEPPAGRCFSEPRWQPRDGRLRSWYLLYRWLVLLLWAAITGCSLLEIGSAKPLHAPEKWPIYLTNWDLALGLLQAFLAALLVSRRWRLERTQPSLSATAQTTTTTTTTTGLELPMLPPPRLGRLERVYWFLNVVTSSLALGVTTIYWSLVHDPSVHQLDAQNFMVHVGNSALMLLDLGLGAVPFELRCFWWCPFLVSFYVLFSLAYYAAGGLGKHGEPRIYNILDWQRPGRTLLVCAGCLSFLVLTHCLLYLLAGLRDRLRARHLTLPPSSSSSSSCWSSCCYCCCRRLRRRSAAAAYALDKQPDKLRRKDEFCV